MIFLEAIVTFVICVDENDNAERTQFLSIKDCYASSFPNEPERDCHLCENGVVHLPYLERSFEPPLHPSLDQKISTRSDVSQISTAKAQEKKNDNHPLHVYCK